MQVTTVKASIKYSKEVCGAWKAVELGAEAVVHPTEDWAECQAKLYADLTDRFRELWAGSNGQKVEQPAPAPQPVSQQETPEHWCAEHQVAFTRREGKFGEFWSHRTGDGKWCNEAKAKA